MLILLLLLIGQAGVFNFDSNGWKTVFVLNIV